MYGTNRSFRKQTRVLLTHDNRLSYAANEKRKTKQENLRNTNSVVTVTVHRMYILFDDRRRNEDERRDSGK